MVKTKGKKKVTVKAKEPTTPRSPTGDNDMTEIFIAFRKPGSIDAIQVFSDLNVRIKEEDVTDIRDAASKDGDLHYETFKKVVNDFIDKYREQEEAGEKKLQPTKSMHAKGALDPAAMKRLNEPIPKGKETVRVVVRVRPFMPYEFKKARDAGQEIEPVVYMNQKECQLLNVENGDVNHNFKFDQCFWSIPDSQAPSGGMPIASQEDVFQYAGVPAVKHAFIGFNTCIFAYGQTGSGKTHSMLGSDKDPGIAPKLIADLFDTMKGYKARGEKTQFEVKVAFLEIYNEKVMDLLMHAPESKGPEEGDIGEGEAAPKKTRRKSSAGSPGSPRKRKKSSMTIGDGDKYRECKVRFSPDKGTYVEGISRLSVYNAQECMNSMKSGMQYRAVASHSLNATSSRSHAIFQICLKQSFILGTTRVSTINIVDLAGSERIKMTHASGSVLDEAKNINQSLSTLRRVIDTLIDNAKKRTNKIPPYRESMLTWVLKDSLGGNSKTIMIAAISPHTSNYDDTLNTLRYALKAKSIILHAHVNEEQTSNMVKALRQELEALKHQMASGGGGGGMNEYEAAELTSAIEELKKTEQEAEEFKKRSEIEMRAKDEEVREEKKQRFAAVFRNAFFIEKKRLANEDILAEKDREIAELKAQLKAAHDEIRSIQDRANERTARETIRMQADADKIEGLEEDKQQLINREGELREDLELARKQTKVAEIKASRFECQVADVKEEMSKLSNLGRDEVDKLRKEVDRLKAVEQEAMRTRLALAESENAVAQKDKKNAHMEGDIRRLNDQVDRVLTEKQELRQLLEESQDTIIKSKEDAQKKRLELERELHIKDVEINQREALMKTLHEEERRMREDFDKAMAEKRSTDEAMSAMRSIHIQQKKTEVLRANDIEEKQQKIAELENEASHARQELMAVQVQLSEREEQLATQGQLGAAASIGFSPSVTPTQPVRDIVNDIDLKGYVADKFFPKGDRRAHDGGKASPLDGRVPGERAWVHNGYAYGPSPHRSPQRSPARASPRSHLSDELASPQYSRINASPSRSPVSPRNYRAGSR
eukprot:TRINITY_DN2272_c0_g1_i2.p1 TRINITY_DN2272_c0_g1~~TRINITY_DN2272_c0_g1_i2.p1  ORF type:complete len:1076 (+),score=286.13 TRINITY_DN2272_c0_g1_i2:72-3230(+)